MAKKKVYKITVDGVARFAQLLYELAQWGEKRFEVVGDCIITSSNNVIDIATETFIGRTHFLHIEAFQQKMHPTLGESAASDSESKPPQAGNLSR